MIVGSHDNIHIPKESWPHFTWYVIEFVIVVLIAFLIAFQVTPLFEEMVVSQGLECYQESHITKCSSAEESTTDESVLNWIFASIISLVFLVWYIGIRGFVLKKKILQNR